MDVVQQEAPLTPSHVLQEVLEHSTVAVARVLPAVHQEVQALPLAVVVHQVQIQGEDNL